MSDYTFHTRLALQPAEAERRIREALSEQGFGILTEIDVQAVLWDDGRPKLVRRLLANGKLAFDFRTASAMAWTIWARLAPSSLRLFMRSIAGTRNALARKSRFPDAAVEWSTPRDLPGSETQGAAVTKP